MTNRLRRTPRAVFERPSKWLAHREPNGGELRTSVNLARLLRDTNRRDEAHSFLAKIYNWFTEGFDLPDLQDAKTLLDELTG